MAVTADDIAVELGRTTPLTSMETAQWMIWIDDALMLIGARLGDVTLLDQTKLDYVVRNAVATHVRRPDDATQVSISVDDASTSRTYRSSKGRVVILDEWWALLDPAGAAGSATAFSIRPGGITANHMPWCSLAFGALYCSCGADLTIYEYPLYEGGVLSGDDY